MPHQIIIKKGKNAIINYFRGYLEILLAKTTLEKTRSLRDFVGKNIFVLSWRGEKTELLQIMKQD